MIQNQNFHVWSWQTCSLVISSVDTPSITVGVFAFAPLLVDFPDLTLTLFGGYKININFYISLFLIWQTVSNFNKKQLQTQTNITSTISNI